MIDNKALAKQHETISSDTHTTFYFEDKAAQKVFKLDAYLTKGELAGTVNIFTHVSSVITSPSFLVFEGKSASARLPAKVPVIEVTVEAVRVGKAPPPP
ncbi:hypothetical protein [Endozoicomonas sp. OPT23]|uniref:hypothetical protein n=1 Tax=Endozoicomonas sp. OPT23 TaxID=2072845 RepID=UPI00129ABE04|nr:hypothetical protein [Endozoicomonas sp. OPT23]